MQTKICCRCKREKAIGEFYKHSRDGCQSMCKLCCKARSKTEAFKQYQRAYQREYSKKPEVKSKLRESKAQYRQRIDVRIKNLARRYTNLAILRGELTREPCATCGKEQGEAHHLDYEQPLMIVWLCEECHRKLHFNLKQGRMPDEKHNS